MPARHPVILRKFCLLAVAAAFGAGLAVTSPAQVPSQTYKVPADQAEMKLGFVPVVKKTAPAVVNIYTRKVVERQFRPFAGDPFFEQFFGNMFPGGTQRRIENSLGSGVIVDPRGIVVSNYHVVGGADEITVVLADRREFHGKVTFADREADLAIVRIEGASDLPALELRDSDTLEVGELVLAIGNPFGVGQTVTSGIVSGLARSAGVNGKGKGYFIQTDAAINPGNSGGALVDMDGKLVGINTSILSRSGGSNGIGFAIPSNLVARVLAEARHGASALVRPWLGFRTQPVTSDIADAIGLPRPEGLLIAEIHPASSFAHAGLETGDILLSIDGDAVNAPSELAFRTDTLGTGQSTTVRYLHDGKVHEARVDLVAAPDRPARDRTTLRTPRPLGGLTVVNINPAVIDQYGLPISSKGVLVAGLDGAAARSGLRTGDLIRGVDGRAVESVQEFESAARRSNRLVLDVERNGERGRLPIGG